MPTVEALPSSAPILRVVPLGVVLLALPLPGFSQRPVQDVSRLGPQDLVQGSAAVERLGSRLPGLARLSGVSADELESHVLNDESVWVDASGQVIFVDPLHVDGDEQSAEPARREGPDIPLGDAFLLHSRPGANHTIYLDFDGHHSVNNSWGHDIVFPAYNVEGGPATFTNNELRQIIDHWRYMAQDFAIFDVDVTTEEPPLHRLRYGGPGDTQWGVRDVHTQVTSGFGSGSGGIAFYWSFKSSLDDPVFSFNKGTNNGSMTGSHEVGHSLGLLHDGLNAQEYHPGATLGTWTWGPIMGAPFNAEIVQWSNGDYAGSSTSQNDISTITSASNGLTLLPDDHGNDLAGATSIDDTCPDPANVQLCGLITGRNDVDTFSFTSIGGQLSFMANRFDPIGNLDCRIEVYDPAGVRLVAANKTRTAEALVVLDIGPGVHTLLIDGGGQPNLYSDYGSRGSYTLDLALPVASHFTDLGNGLAGSTGIPTLSGSGWACADTQVSVALSNAQPNSPAYLTYGAQAAYVPFLGGVLVPSLGAGGGYLAQATDAQGEVSGAGTWPTGVMPGGTFHFQYWVADPAGPKGFSASNALVITAP